MKMRLGEIRLQPQRFGKFRGGLLRIGFLHQHCAEIVMQLRALRLQFDRPAQFADGTIEVSGKIQGPPQRAMRLGIVRSQPRGLARLTQRGLQVSFSNKRVTKIHVRLHELGFQLHRSPKLRDGRINFSLSEQDPAQRVVSFWTLRRKPNNSFEIRASRNQIALLQRRHASLVSCSRPRSSIRLRRICGLRSAHPRSSAEEKDQRRTEVKKTHPTMREIRFHAKKSCSEFLKILTCSLSRASPQAV